MRYRCRNVFLIKFNNLNLGARLENCTRHSTTEKQPLDQPYPQRLLLGSLFDGGHESGAWTIAGVTFWGVDVGDLDTVKCGTRPLIVMLEDDAFEASS